MKTISFARLFVLSMIKDQQREIAQLEKWLAGRK
jgi:hypothetical protein